MNGLRANAYCLDTHTDEVAWHRVRASYASPRMALFLCFSLMLDVINVNSGFRGLLVPQQPSGFVPVVPPSGTFTEALPGKALGLLSVQSFAYPGSEVPYPFT